MNVYRHPSNRCALSQLVFSDEQWNTRVQPTEPVKTFTGVTYDENVMEALKRAENPTEPVKEVEKWKPVILPEDLDVADSGMGKDELMNLVTLKDYQALEAKLAEKEGYIKDLDERYESYMGVYKERIKDFKAELAEKEKEILSERELVDKLHEQCDEFEFKLQRVESEAASQKESFIQLIELIIFYENKYMQHVWNQKKTASNVQAAKETMQGMQIHFRSGMENEAGKQIKNENPMVHQSGEQQGEISKILCSTSEEASRKEQEGSIKERSNEGEMQIGSNQCGDGWEDKKAKEMLGLQESCDNTRPSSRLLETIRRGMVVQWLSWQEAQNLEDLINKINSSSAGKELLEKVKTLESCLYKAEETLEWLTEPSAPYHPCPHQHARDIINNVAKEAREALSQIKAIKTKGDV